jgi:hypothetical protein
MTQTTETPMPELGTPIGIPWQCPEWCTVDHEADGYLRHGHVVHQTAQPLSAGQDAGYWYSPIGTWRECPDAVVEVHLPFEPFSFTSGDALRAHAAELVAIAARLDEMNAQVA